MKMNVKRLWAIRFLSAFVILIIAGFIVDFLFGNEPDNIVESLSFAFVLATVFSFSPSFNFTEIFISDNDVELVKDELKNLGFYLSDETPTKKIYLKKVKRFFWKKVILKEKVNYFSLKLPHNSEYEQFKKYRHI